MVFSMLKSSVTRWANQSSASGVCTYMSMSDLWRIQNGDELTVQLPCVRLKGGRTPKDFPLQTISYQDSSIILVASSLEGLVNAITRLLESVGRQYMWVELSPSRDIFTIRMDTTSPSKSGPTSTASLRPDSTD